MNPSSITFSRHARRRLHLYNISEESVLTLIRHSFNTSNLLEGKHEVVEDLAHRHEYPLKVVFSYHADKATVITAYPLKKGRKP